MPDLFAQLATRLDLETVTDPAQSPGPEPLPERRPDGYCAATNRTNGKPCGAFALRTGPYCRIHSSSSSEWSRIGVEARSKAAEARRARRRKLGDVLADRLQAEAEQVAERLSQAARSADDRVAVGAIKEWTRLVYGRNLERSEDETEGEERPALDVARMTREERMALVERMATSNPALARRLLGPQAVDETTDSTPTP